MADLYTGKGSLTQQLFLDALKLGLFKRIVIICGEKSSEKCFHFYKLLFDKGLVKYFLAPSKENQAGFAEK